MNNVNSNKKRKAEVELDEKKEDDHPQLDVEQQKINSAKWAMTLANNKLHYKEQDLKERAAKLDVREVAIGRREANLKKMELLHARFLVVKADSFPNHTAVHKLMDVFYPATDVELAELAFEFRRCFLNVHESDVAFEFLYDMRRNEAGVGHSGLRFSLNNAMEQAVPDERVRRVPLGVRMYKEKLGVGGKIDFLTPQGPRTFPL